MGFLLPKIVGVTDYGYYKTFTLYATYIGLFHFGIADGILLKFGGYDYENLDRPNFRFYSSVYAGTEAIIGAIVCAVSLIFLTEEYSFIFFWLGLYLVAHNVTGYYQSISQATSRFKELSSRNVIQSALTVLAILALWIYQKASKGQVSYRAYTIIYVLIAVALAGWYIYTYRDITFNKRAILWKDIPSLIKLGFPLTIANLCASLVLTLDRQFVNVLFDKDTYAVYAFAYNMLSLVTTATGAISTVLYPNLKKAKKEILEKNYSKLISTVLGFVFGCLVLYFPLCIFVKWFLPKFTDSLLIYRIIFPGLAISSAISIVMNNYYKTMNQSFLYFKKSVVILIVSGIANYIAYFFFHTPASISISSIITMLIWYVYVESVFINKYRVKRSKNIIYMLAMMVSFYVITEIPNHYLSGAVYVVVFLFLTYLMVWKDIRSFLHK